MNARAAAAELAGELAVAGVPDAAFEAELLARHAAGISRARFFAGAELSAGERQRLRALAERRRLREPYAYISGQREFYGLDFAVTRDVLIPRPETELLVDVALAELRSQPDATLVDVGTGSGCIAVAIARTAPRVRVIGTDMNALALRVAHSNAERLAPGVALVRGDLAAALCCVDIVLANLPYIPRDQIDALEPEVARWEPRIALDGGPDGFRELRRLIVDCAERLRPKLLALEVGLGQAPAVAAFGIEHRATVTLERDLAGIDRVVCLRWA